METSNGEHTGYIGKQPTLYFPQIGQDLVCWGQSSILLPAPICQRGIFWEAHRKQRAL
jgi:hypothetical protein